LMWDFFNLLPDEFKLYTESRKGLWKQPATYAFLVLRYSAILAAFPSLFFTSIQTNLCHVTVILSQIGVCLVVASSGMIFAYRVSAIWSGNKTIYGIVGFFYTAMLGSWIAVGRQYQATTGPHTDFGSNCILVPVVSWAGISYASSVAFDAVILILTVAKVNLYRSAQSKVGYIIYRDSLLYFLLTAATNITVLIIEASQSEYNSIKPAALPFATLITVAMSSRVYLNLKLFNQRQEKVGQGLPSHSHTSSFNGIPQRNADGKHMPMPMLSPMRG